MVGKKKRTLKTILIVTLACLVLAGIIVLIRLTQASDDYSEKYAGVDLSEKAGSISRENTYTGYLEEHPDTACPDFSAVIPAASVSASENTEILDEYEGKKQVLLTGETGFAEWTVTIPETGFYYMEFVYCPVLSRGINPERELLINGKLLFRGLDCQTFTRFFTDDPETDGKTDNRGNEIRAQQVEILQYATKAVEDDMNGYVNEPYKIFFNAGENTIRLTGVSEPLVLSEIRILPVTDAVNYHEYSAANPEGNATGFFEKIQGEDATLRSSASLYPTWDHSAPDTEPYNITLSTLNKIGGSSWTVNGQWIEWTVEVPESGLYRIAFKARQTYNRGQESSRKLLIDGALPFDEVSEIAFGYDTDWVTKTLGDGEKEYDFYLEKGTHTIRLEVTLGQLAPILGELEDSIYRLNEIYRQLLVIMGRNPDRYRDYDILGPYPDMKETMLLESQRLYKIADELIEVTGGRSSRTATITVTAALLERWVGNMDLIKRQLSTFRDDITSLGTTMTNLTNSQLDVDYLVVRSSDMLLNIEKAGFFAHAAHEVRSFIASFTTDYNTLGDVHEDQESIVVWILTGRDQANILKTIIDDTFTPETGIAVNLKLVDSGAVMSAIAAGTGPDIILSSGQGDPVNYALRGAVEDLRQFEDCEEILKLFDESAWVPFEYEGGLYALPETQGFNVLYYREDILEELGVEVPKTWDELEELLPILQNNNMQVGFPDIMKKSGYDLSGFFSMMYQNGALLYDEEGTRALLDDEGAIQAFERYASFYTDYEQASDYSFVDRFRSGEMPIGITNYGTQNTLAVFAPELKGLWSFTLSPGTEREDGTIDYSVMSYVSSCLMLKTDDEQKKQNAWEFLKWWVSTETQARFGNEMECLMGASARYMTANVEAFQQLSWSTEELAILNEARSYTVSNKEVAGGYYTGRHIVNAIRRVVNEDSVPRETLLDYNKTINDEIEKKRAEFNLE